MTEHRIEATGANDTYTVGLAAGETLLVETDSPAASGFIEHLSNPTGGPSRGQYQMPVGMIRTFGPFTSAELFKIVCCEGVIVAKSGIANVR